MSHFLPRATTAKRRGVVLAMAAGALALGAAVPASASSSSHSSASASASNAKSKPSDTTICRAVPGAKAVKPAKPANSAKSAKAVGLTEVGKATGTVRADDKKVTVAPKDGARGHGDVCAIPTIPAFPGKPGKVCTHHQGQGRDQGRRLRRSRPPHDADQAGQADQAR
ncbi:hypothetical protein [Streptomyces violaceusniger]|uniref:hypothetical protein n=1 Tax=Streptomyces violaceusniger TaxID=68280 RepID=UPI00381FBD34